MKIRNIFEKSIDRTINGVVKVSDENLDTLKQELEEYVVTKELRPHFNKFFNNFSDSFNNKQKIGVWISGFFGSGKSHFLKILSYLLENKRVDDKNALDYFRDKFNDPLGFSLIEQCCSQANKTILFNIDSISGDKTKTAIKDVFAQMFYNSLGFFGRNLKVVRLEKYLTKENKYQDFVNRFNEICKFTWDESRKEFPLRKSLMIQALVESGAMSQQDAESFFDDKTEVIFNIDALTDDICEYVNSQSEDFRLVFMVDEIGQYIGEDMNLMLNLQTLVEDLGTKCNGKVWVIVTSQEAIDKVIKVKGDQFSKIMGRFDTRIHLTSSSVEEVVKKRLLEKNAVAKQTLSVVYNSKSASLKNIFTFEQATAELKGYDSENSFIDTYPFVPYQFRLFQDVLNELRVHDQAGFDTSDNSRNMLGAFKLGITEAKDGQVFEDLEIGNNNDGALFSFDRFFDTISEKVNSMTRELVIKAEDDGRLIKYDIKVLKLLYLIRYVDKDLKATIPNIAILMTDSIDSDQISLRKKVAESLERLCLWNYVSKNGDVYKFLSNEEKEIESEIKNIFVPTEDLSKAIGDIVFGDIYPSKKARYDVYDFEFDRYVDDMPIGSMFNAPLKLMIVTPDNPLTDVDNASSLAFESMKEGRVLVVLPNENDFYNKLREVAKVEKFNKTKNQSSSSQTVKSVIQTKVEQARIDRKAISISIETAIKNADFYIQGQKLNVKGTTAKEKLVNVLSELIVSVYTKLDNITGHFNTVDEIKSILKKDENAIGGNLVSNPDAVADLEQYLVLKGQSHSTVTVAQIFKRYKDKPYGYRDFDIAAMIAELICDQKVVISYQGKEYKKSDTQVVTFLTSKAYMDSAIVKQRVAIDPILLSKCINIIKDFTNSMDVPNKEDDFIDYAINVLKHAAQECSEFISEFYNHGNYPQKDAVKSAQQVYNDILLYQTDATKFLEKLKERETDLLDAQSDIADVVAFFKGPQKKIFDDAYSKYEFYKDDASYLNEDVTAKTALEAIDSILHFDRPFSKIANLPSLVSSVKEIHEGLLAKHKNVALTMIDKARKELATYVKVYSKPIYEDYIRQLDDEAKYIENAIKIVAVVAEESRIQKIKGDATTALLNAKPAEVEVNDEPKEPEIVSKDELLETATLKTKGEVDQYLEKLKSEMNFKDKANNKDNQIKENNSSLNYLIDDNNSNNIFLPKVLCFASLLPFHRELSKILKNLYDYFLFYRSNMNKTINSEVSLNNDLSPIEKVIEQIVMCTPIPLSIKNEYCILYKFHFPLELINSNPSINLKMAKSKSENLSLSQKAFPYNNTNINFQTYDPLNSFLNNIDSISLIPIFYYFTEDEVIKLFKYILLEIPILFFSENIELLTSVIEGFLSLLHPFEYVQPHISVLPSKFYGIINIEYKFIFGINEAYNLNFFKNNKILLDKAITVVYFSNQKAKIEVIKKIEEQKDYAIIDNYDIFNFINNDSTLPNGAKIEITNIELPLKYMKNLHGRIKTLVNETKKKKVNFTDDFGNNFNQKIRYFFYKFFVNILSGFTDYLQKIPKYDLNDTKKEGFYFGDNIRFKINFINNNYNETNNININNHENLFIKAIFNG